jgi:HEAT repeat protein
VRKLLGLLVLLVFAAGAAANVDDLIKKLKSKDSDVRREAASSLSELGKDAKPAAKALTAALKDSDRFVRRYAAQALGKIGPDAKDSVPALARLLNDDAQPVREAAVKALGQMGPAGVPALSKALPTASSDVQEHAITALAGGGAEALPALAGAIKNRKMDASLRRKAVAAVIALDTPTARKALPALSEAVKDARAGGREGQQLRIDSIKALGRLARADDKDAVSALSAIANNAKLRDNNQLKRAARNALSQVEKRN